MEQTTRQAAENVPETIHALGTNELRDEVRITEEAECDRREVDEPSVGRGTDGADTTREGKDGASHELGANEEAIMGAEEAEFDKETTKLCEDGLHCMNEVEIKTCLCFFSRTLELTERILLTEARSVIRRLLVLLSRHPPPMRQQRRRNGESQKFETVNGSQMATVFRAAPYQYVFMFDSDGVISIDQKNPFWSTNLKSVPKIHGLRKRHETSAICIHNE
jgi:hypothetical protein